MNCTSLTMAGLLAALSLGIPSLADSIAPGILLPKKNTKSISFSPKGTSDIFLLGIMPQGSSVKKGESVAQADFRILDNSIEDYERAIKSKNLEVLKLRYALDQQKERSALALQKYQTALTRTEEDQKVFLEKRKARMLAEEEERVNKALRHMSYKQEELNQLTKMYKDDQVAEETEEIILKRLKMNLGKANLPFREPNSLRNWPSCAIFIAWGKTMLRQSRKSRWIWNRQGSRRILTWNRKR